MEVTRDDLAGKVDARRVELLDALHLSPRQLQARVDGSVPFNASELLVTGVMTGLRVADLVEFGLDPVEELRNRGVQRAN
jgi:hypothetical protein